MIIYPNYWKSIGQPITTAQIEKQLGRVLKNIDCNNVAFSGGVDSTLLLYHLSKIYDNVFAFVMGSSINHPDVIAAREIAARYPNVVLRVYVPSQKDIDAEKAKGEEFDGDASVRLFYKYVSQYTNRIIAGDGIDEFMGGYYAHQQNINEETYYKFLRKLQLEQLVPLNKNSSDVNVYLPYIDKSLVLMFSQIPLHEKVNKTMRKRLMMKMVEGKMPAHLLERRKRGFCDALKSDDKLNVIHIIDTPSRRVKNVKNKHREQGVREVK